MENKSILKIYRGTRYLGSSTPILAVTGDSTNSSAVFGEYYVFHSVSGVPFLYQRSSCAMRSGPSAYAFDDFPEVFSAEALVTQQHAAARDRLEYEITRYNAGLAHELFWSSRPLEFRETDGSCFVRFKALGQFVEERKTMFTFTRSKTVKELEKSLSQIPEVAWQLEPGN